MWCKTKAKKIKKNMRTTWVFNRITWYCALCTDAPFKLLIQIYTKFRYQQSRVIIDFTYIYLTWVWYSVLKRVLLKRATDTDRTPNLIFWENISSRGDSNIMNHPHRKCFERNFQMNIWVGAFVFFLLFDSIKFDCRIYCSAFSRLLVRSFEIVDFWRYSIFFRM